MSKLVETSRWEDEIYQIEMSDPVEGGPEGISNRQAKQLGNRTLYLKQQVEQSQAGLSGHVVAADPHPQYATKGDLAERIAALVGQSPETLNTLKELADALGNDPNFATTVTNQLAKKAPLDSPALVGSPKTPTPAQFDAGPAVANAEFVQRALGNFQSSMVLAAATTLTPAQAGSAISLNGGSSVVLPLYSAVKRGATFLFMNSDATPKTISRQGGDVLYGPSGGALSSTATSFTLLPGDWALISAVYQWEMMAGSPLMTINNGAYEFSHGAAGYERSPTGRIEQWGQGATDANGEVSIVFPKRFPNACFNVAANHVGLGAATVIVVHGSLTQDGVKLRAFNETGGTYPGWLVYWRATGK